jgi:polysaccharide export outer membrane protein
MHFFALIRKMMGLVLTVLFLSSCVPQHKIVYAQSKEKDKPESYPVLNNKGLKIEPFDMLYISIGSASGEPTEYNFFNQDKQNYNSMTELSLSVLGYTVNDSGAITLPVIGKLHLQGLTLDQASSLIRDSTKSVISHPIVSVRFVNNSITVLGEVGKAGTYPYPNEHLTIFYALGLAGDITEYGNRKEVVLIRETNKAIHKYYLDLTSDDIFRSDFYYLRPNDVLYVAPLQVRRFGMKEYPFALVVSAVTAVFLALYYIKK